MCSNGLVLMIKSFKVIFSVSNESHSGKEQKQIYPVLV